MVIIDSLTEARANGNLPGGYNVEVPRDNLFFTLLINILPFFVIDISHFLLHGPNGWWFTCNVIWKNHVRSH